MGMFFTLTLNRKMNRLYPKCANSEGQALSVVEQILMQIPVIKSFAMEERMREKVHGQYGAVRDTEMKIATPNALLQTACSSTAQIPRILYLIFAGSLVLNGQMTIGALIAVFDLLNYIIGPSVYFPFMLNGLNRSAASINRISKLGRLPQKATKQKQTETVSAVMVSMEHLSFSYAEGKPVINDLSFAHTGPGIVVVSGKSGCGKTTLLDLISGLIEPKEGSISVSGGVSAVSQDTYLFAESLFNNVRLARPDASEQDVVSALALAGADRFAASLPQGTHTLIGDGGADLSGGQKQRVSLARTILADNPIWLLDEPTSALDAETEQVVLAVIKEMSVRKLIFISAHRQSLINLADRRIEL
jgi:ABC-type bacteriocin/lantibiotic exporter with double-glycine peptidase domain